MRRRWPGSFSNSSDKGGGEWPPAARFDLSSERRCHLIRLRDAMAVPSRWAKAWLRVPPRRPLNVPVRAYGAVQAGTYNTRALIPEVLVRASEWALVRPRVTAEELIALDRLPGWL
jgi:hypothetical protein